MKKKIMTIIAVFVLVFAFATSALAANPYSFSSSSCYKTFITSGSLTKSTSQTWTRFWIVNSKSDRFYKVRDLLNSAGDKYPSVPCKRMLLNQ